MPKQIRQTVLPLLAALIWGTAFVMQKGNEAGALTFNAARSLIAFLFLLPVILLFTKGDFRHILSEESREDTRALWLGGFLCGVMLAGATFLQQYGLDHGTEAGKAGFLTALYMVLVPVFGLFFRKKVGLVVWAAVGIALIGLYLLSFTGGFGFRTSDLIIIPCAVLFAVQILLIEYFSRRCDCIRLSCIQFLTCFVLSAAFAPIAETPDVPALFNNIWQILYLGILSSGIAYTLQMVSLKGTNTTVVSILLSMESVFSVIAGAVILKEQLTAREYVGCALMLAAVILPQFQGSEDKGLEELRN
ncbi:MAG: DMT family transporter [Lachnospiraceae bacterium]|nr:DMT family transporter [Lachnospiraceae bacterium]